MACDAETGVEDLYKKVQLPQEWVERLTHEFEEEIVERQTTSGELRVTLTKRVATLAEERQKLLRTTTLTRSLSNYSSATRTGSRPRKRRPSAS